jgi:hypothetical protein
MLGIRPLNTFDFSFRKIPLAGGTVGLMVPPVRLIVVFPHGVTFLVEKVIAIRLDGIFWVLVLLGHRQNERCVVNPEDVRAVSLDEEIENLVESVKSPVEFAVSVGVLVTHLQSVPE